MAPDTGRYSKVEANLTVNRARTRGCDYFCRSSNRAKRRGVRLSFLPLSTVVDIGLPREGSTPIQVRKRQKRQPHSTTLRAVRWRLGFRRCSEVFAIRLHRDRQKKSHPICKVPLMVRRIILFAFGIQKVTERRSAQFLQAHRRIKCC